MSPTFYTLSSDSLRCPATYTWACVDHSGIDTSMYCSPSASSPCLSSTKFAPGHSQLCDSLSAARWLLCLAREPKTSENPGSLFSDPVFIVKQFASTAVCLRRALGVRVLGIKPGPAPCCFEHQSDIDPIHHTDAILSVYCPANHSGVRQGGRFAHHILRGWTG